MPNITLMNPETKQSTLRPVVMDIIRQIMEITRIPTETSILFPDDINKTHQPGSAVSEEARNRTIFPSNDKVQIDVEEQYDETSILSTAVARPEHLPIFTDDEIGVMVKPVYSKTNVAITFRYKSNSKIGVNRWRDDIRTRTSTGRDINLHKGTYSYAIPIEIMIILKEIHRLRELQAGYDESFELYILNKFTTRFTELTNQGGTYVQPAIAETQMRIVGMFDFSYAPEKIENAEDSEGWIGAFSYRFSFDKAVACNLRYPAMIHNQTLSKKYRPSEEAYDIDKHMQSFSLSMDAFAFFEAQQQLGLVIDPKAGMTLPWYDEFQPNSIPSGSVSIFSALCQILPDNLREICDLKDLGTVGIDADILKFMMESEYPFLAKPYKSILNVSLYKSMRLQKYDQITVDNQLMVRSTADLSLRTSHRIRFSIIADWQLLDKAALDRLRLYPEALVKVISAVNDALRNNTGFKDLPIGRITRDTLYGYLSGSDQIRRNTVQITNVIAARRTD